MRILVTGATGYVGGRLVPELLAQGHEVVCLARRPEKLADRQWADAVEVVEADLLDRESLDPAVSGCDLAFYLVHSMGHDQDFVTAEATSARNFAAAASEAGLRRLVYLGGLGSDDHRLSRHLSSRHRVGQILRDGSVPVTELRAAIVIGSGSLSFEMLRHLTEVLPVMTTPRWVRSRCQPIAIRDLLSILSAATAEDSPGSEIIEIGGPDVVTYEQMMRIYADEAGLARRLILPLPMLSPGLSSLWIGLVTPVPAAAARLLVGSLRHDVVVRDTGVAGFPDVVRTPLRAAIRATLSPATIAPGQPTPGIPEAALESDPLWAGGSEYVDRRAAVSTGTPERLAAIFTGIGGRNGYFAANWAWRLRGMVDRVLGGPGLRRGRRDPHEIEPGEKLDFWRVADHQPGRRLLLEAEMRLPGRAWLEFSAEAHGSGSRLLQTAYFRPRGLSGRLYWLALRPAHVAIFSRMARNIAKTAGSP